MKIIRLLFPIRYYYFVSYTFGKSGNITGFGKMEVESTEKITSLKQIIKIENMLKEKFDFESCVLINYTLLKKTIRKVRN